MGREAHINKTRSLIKNLIETKCIYVENTDYNIDLILKAVLDYRGSKSPDIINAIDITGISIDEIYSIKRMNNKVKSDSKRMWIRENVDPILLKHPGIKHSSATVDKITDGILTNSRQLDLQLSKYINEHIESMIDVGELNLIE